ncbi:MAG TPA: type III-A CRISPR-associated protein Csm2 [Bryobacteraceae bacterium]
MDEEVKAESPAAVETAPVEESPKPEQRPQERPKEERPREERPPDERSNKREERPKRDERRGPPQGAGDRPGNRGGDRGRENRGEGGRGERREGGRPPGGRPFEGPPEIEIEKLISDSLYLDNQAHAIVARMRDMDSGTKSQLRRLYNAVRRAVRAPENERQHHFVMLRARLAYTIARHSLRSLDALERLLLQVTRKNDARGYERFKDLFEAIVAYNE